MSNENRWVWLFLLLINSILLNVFIVSCLLNKEPECHMETVEKQCVRNAQGGDGNCEMPDGLCDMLKIFGGGQDQCYKKEFEIEVCIE